MVSIQGELQLLLGSADCLTSHTYVLEACPSVKTGKARVSLGASAGGSFLRREA